MRTLVALVLLAGVAVAKRPAWRPPPTDGADGAARLSEAIRNHDTASALALLHDAVTFDGLWFADASCAKRFGRRGVAEKAELRVLAQCLVQQKPIATTRRSSLVGGAILTFEPGFEIEVLFKGDRLVAIFAPWASDADRGSPMLTVQTFEGLRTAGTTLLDGALADKLSGPASAWIKVCVDPSGVTTTSVAEAKPADAGAIFIAAIADWKFRAFEHRKTRLAACSFSLLDYPASNAPPVEVLPASPTSASLKVKDTDLDSPYEFDFDGVELEGYPGTPTPPQNVPPSLLEKHRTRGSKDVAPDPITKVDIAKAGKTTAVASLKMCVDTRGKVQTVSLLKSSGFPDYDRKLDREVRNWAYKPFLVKGTATAVCTAVTFIYRANP